VFLTVSPEEGLRKYHDRDIKSAFNRIFIKSKARNLRKVISIPLQRAETVDWDRYRHERLIS
jgi:hypothetical protein